MDSGRQNNIPPDDVHILILRNCEYVTLLGQMRLN